jgi:hypothetical protein
MGLIPVSVLARFVAPRPAASTLSYRTMSDSNQASQFVSPPPAGPQTSVLDQAIVYTLGEPLNISWLATYTDYNLTMFSLVHVTPPLNILSMPSLHVFY